MEDSRLVFVETLGKCFGNVCELDMVFNYSKMRVFGGQVLETSSTEVKKAVEEISKLEAFSNSITLVSKTVSGWRSRQHIDVERC
ncbi:AP-3 complex subunit sigma isoform X2 [Hevea brasiliensis]|uniref:AP-3 complex subunit sigma isoform X2 n=1 Tax=Hevea brasiliensis TaxID=3981 RepID=UPI000B7817E1|nr:AP-3 complex subunit sigma isoform X2 [Hevea brasiliensis]